MRKILMTATVLAGAAFASHAMAQGIATAPVITDDFSAANVSAGGDAPAPGSVVVTWRTRLWTDVGYASDTGQNAKNAGVTTGGKSQGFEVLNYVRMYPKLDAVAANGLLYGAAIQIRQNMGANGSSSGSTMYIRNAYMYLGTPVAGKLYVGEAPGALTSFMVGTLESFDVTGGWNGDAINLLSSGTVVQWNWLDNGGTYTTNKLVYVSPKYAGFDVAASFEPNYQVASGQCAYASSSCSNAASVIGGEDTRKNTYDVAARYTGSFGPVAAIIEGGYMGSGVVANSSGALAYKGIGLADVGAQFTVAGFLVGAHYDFGSIAGNGSYQPLLSGGKKESSAIGGVQYTWGTMTAGVQLIASTSGNPNVALTKVATLREQGLAVGGAWDYASGAAAYATVLYGQRHENGVNLYTSAANTNHVGNNTTARVLMIGNRFSW